MTQMNKNGVSITVRGEEKYEYFKSSITRGQQLCQYDYRDESGKLFSCVKRTLTQCRFACRRWLINEALRLRQTEILLAMQGTIDQDPDHMMGLSNELDAIVFSVDRQ